MEQQALANLISQLSAHLTPKPGAQSSELWLQIVGLVPALLAAFMPPASPLYLVLASVCAAVPVFYTNSRGKLKSNAVNAAAEAIKAAAEAVNKAAAATGKAAPVLLLALAASVCACSTAQVQKAGQDAQTALVMACQAARQAVATCDALKVPAEVPAPAPATAPAP